MGLLDYYRQYEDMDQEEINRALRERRAREKATALAVVPKLNLSSTEWPNLPHSEAMNAAIFAARGRVNDYPDRLAAHIRQMLAERHEVQPEQLVLGNGAAELLQTAAFVLLEHQHELVTPWPSYPLYPLMAQRAGGKPVAVDLSGDAVDVDALCAAVNENTRIVVICNPNDPTGTYLPAERIGALLSQLPREVAVFLDEAYIQFQDVEPPDACLRLVDAFPNLLVFRTFSKIYGMAGIRAGYVVGSAASGELLSAMAPALGVNALTQAAIRYVLEFADMEVARRRTMVLEQRRRVLDALHDLPVDAPASEANFIWMRTPGLSGAELAGKLEDEGVLVAQGGPLGADDHVRASIRGAAGAERLLTALQRSLSSDGAG